MGRQIAIWLELNVLDQHRRRSEWSAPSIMAVSVECGKAGPKYYACSARMRSMMSWTITMPRGEATSPGRRLWKNCAEIMNADLVRIHVKQLQQEVQDHCKL